jgi:hypothetical protein
MRREQLISAFLLNTTSVSKKNHAFDDESVEDVGD